MDRDEAGRSFDPAVRDAEAILARAAADERQAEVARSEYRDGIRTFLEPTPEVMPHLERDERVIAARPSATLATAASPTAIGEVAGPLYLTDRRLLILAEPPRGLPLGAIDEVALVGERLLISLRDGTGVTIEVAGPRLLRVQISAVLAGVRG